MKSRLFSTVLVCLLILILPAKSFCQSASQICIPTKAFDGLVEDSYKATKYESLYKDEVEISRNLRQQATYSAQQILNQDSVIVSAGQVTNTLKANLSSKQEEVTSLAKKVNTQKAFIKVLGVASTVLLILVAL